jgi:sigma-E factor negative regulatory protein RseC
MIEETARVVSLADDQIRVETQRRTACGNCSVNQSCGTALLSRFLGVKRNTVHVLNPHRLDIAVGDEVVIGIDEQAITRGSLAVYTVPLLAMFIFAFVGELLSRRLSIPGEDLLVISFALLGLLCGFMWVKRFSQNIRHDPHYQPQLLRKVSANRQTAVVQVRFQP